MRVGLDMARVRAKDAMPRARPQFFSLSLDLPSGSGRDGYFRRVTPAFTRTFGYPEAELLDRPFISFVHPDDRGATLAELEKLAHGRPAHAFEHRFRGRDGAF